MGGAINSIDSDLTLTDTEFIENRAFMGGAIHMRCPKSSICDYELIDCTFTDNRAMQRGGAIHYYDFRPVLSNVSFMDNTSPYGPDIGSYSSGL